jgi:branched-chain amino acid transport system permease protein
MPSTSLVSSAFAYARLWPWLLFAAALIAAPLLSSKSIPMSALSQAAIAIVFAVSYNLLYGQSGLLSFGHAVFMGLGGYATVHTLQTIANAHLPVPLPLVPLAGAAFGGLAGLVLGWLASRRGGTVFAMITMGFAELVVALTTVLLVFFGGDQGRSGDRTSALPVFGIDFAGERQVYYLIAAWTLVAVVLMYLLTRTPLGRIARALRDNPERLPFVGYDASQVRWRMFTASSMFAGLAGGLYAINYEILTPHALGIETSASVLIMVVLGGASTFAGPILGAVFFTWLRLDVAHRTEAWQLYLGILFVCTVLLAPQGLSGMVHHFRGLARQGRLALRLPFEFARGIALVWLVAGTVLAVEAGWLLSQVEEKGAVLKVFGTATDVRSAPVWLVTALLLAAGAMLWRIASRKALASDAAGAATVKARP